MTKRSNRAPKLKYCPAPDPPASDTYQFPAAAAAIANTRHAALRAARRGTEFDSIEEQSPEAGELLRNIEDTLDRMQTRLDRFRQDVEKSYLFPTASPLAKSPPPSSAA